MTQRNISALIAKMRKTPLFIAVFLYLANPAFASTSFISVAEDETLIYTAPTELGNSDSYYGESDGVGTLLIESGTNAALYSIGESSFSFDTPEISSLLALNIEQDASIFVNRNIAATHVTSAGTIFFDTSTNIAGSLAGTGTGTFNLSRGEHAISGSFTTLSGDTIALLIASDAEGGSFTGGLTASGSALLASGTKLNIAFNSALEASELDGSSYTVVSGGSGSQINDLSDTNINVADSGTNRYGDVIFRATVSGNNLIVNAFAKNTALAGLSGESEAYDAIFLADATGTLGALQAFIDSNINSNISKAQAIESATPQADNSTNRVIFNAHSASFNLISDRLGSLRNNNTGFSSGDANISNSIWIEQFGSVIKQGTVASAQGYQSESSGIAIGADNYVTPNLVVGFSANYARSENRSQDALKETNIDSYQGTIYSGYTINDTYFINGVLGVSWNNYMSSRIIPVTNAVARSDYSGRSYIGRVETGFNHIIKDSFILTPTFMVTAARNTVEHYTEKGADTLNLNVRTKSSDFLETRFSTKFSYRFVTQTGKEYQPYIAVSYGYDFAASKQITNSNFIGQTTSFQSSGAKIAQGNWKIGTGLNMYDVNDVSISANYDYDVRDNYHGHLGSVKMKVSF